MLAMAVSELPESEGAERLQHLETEHQELTHSLLSLTTHFAQVQFRLKQILAAEPDEREKMLQNLEEVASHGCPDVRTREESTNLLQLLSEKDYEERLREQKGKQQTLILQLQEQLQELERHSLDSQQRAQDLQTRFDPDLAERQRALIEGLKSRLHLNIDIMNSMSMDEVDRSVQSAVDEVTRPARTKDQQIKMLSSQVTDLERYVQFLKDNPGSRVGNQRVVRKEPKHQAVRTHGQSTRSEDIGSGFHYQLPCSEMDDEDDDDLDGDDESEHSHLTENKTTRSKRKKQSQQRNTTVLHELAAGTLEWFTGLVCGITSARQVAESRRVKCSILCERLNQSVDNVLTLAAGEANSSPEDEMQLVNRPASTPSEEFTQLARIHLGNTLMDVFHHGLREPLVGSGLVPGWHTISCIVVPSNPVTVASRSREHVWRVFEQFYAVKKGHEYNSTPARTLSSAFNMSLDGGVAVTPRQRLFDDMMNIQRTHEVVYRSPDVKFRSLVCAGLNHGVLANWCSMVLSSEELIAQHYDTWACARCCQQSIISDLERLSQLRFNLSLGPPPARGGAEGADVVTGGPAH